MQTEKKHVTIYTDGSALGNPGPGGYGVILRFGSHTRELSGGFRCTTNNRMEILAAIEALRALTEPCRVTLHTDSQYLSKAMTQGWAERWRKNQWMRNKKDPALNADLWADLLDLVAEHDVTFVWVRGHNGDEANERCDVLARKAATEGRLPADPGYDASQCR
jgi:ribonuclease HI